MSESPTNVFQERVGPLKVWQWLALIAVIGFALRVPVALTFSMWVDDGHTLKTLPMSTSELIHERITKGHFPWFFIVYQWWTRLTGDSIFALRFPSLVATLCSLPIAAAIGGRMAGAKGALAAGVLIAVHSTMLRHAAELRMYSWMMLVGAGMMLSVLRLAERPTVGRAVCLGVLHLIYLQLHASAVFYTIPLFLAAGAFGWKRKLSSEFIIGLLSAFLVPIVITIPCIAYLAMKHDKGESTKFIRKVPFVDFAQVMFQLGFGVDRKVKVWRLFCALFVPLTAIWMIAKASRADSASDGTKLSASDIAILVLIAAYVGPLFAWLATVAGAPIFGATRYYLGGVVPLIALFGAGLVSMRRPTSRQSWGVMLAIAAGWIIGGREATEQSMRIYNGGIKINQMIAALKAEAPPGSILLVTHDVGVPEVVNYYLGKDHQFAVYSFSRDMTDLEVREFLNEKIDPKKDLYVFLYKGIKNQFLPIIEEDYGPWADQTRYDKGQPTWYHFVRDKSGQ